MGRSSLIEGREEKEEETREKVFYLVQTTKVTAVSNTL